MVGLSGGGFAAVADDDSFKGIMAFSPSGDLPEEDDGGPLWAMLSADATKERRTRTRRRARPRLASAETRATPVRSGARLYYSSGLSAVSDVRVAPLVKSAWNQKEANGKKTYNLYTPGNLYCGCTATAMAQLMRYHEYPTSPVTPRTFTCYSNDVEVALSMMGGTYDWSSMPLVPSSSTSDAARQMIGRICYDAGVSVRTRYAAGGSGAYLCFSFEPLRSVFGFASAQAYWEDDYSSIAPSTIQNGILSNLDAGCPVLLGISCNSAGHAIIADGYGYEGSTLWCHLNMGWGGLDDLWYALPDINAGGYAFNSVEDVVYNVFPRTTGELVTGRVTDDEGNPLEGATVTATYKRKSGGTAASTTATTSATGIYAVHVPTDAAYSVTLTASYGAAATAKSVSTATSSSASPVNVDFERGEYSADSGGLQIGNSWGNDMVVVPAVGDTAAVGSFTAGENGSADGFSLSFSGTPGARYRVEFSSTLTNQNWTVVTNIFLGTGGAASLVLPSGDEPAGFWRIAPDD